MANGGTQAEKPDEFSRPELLPVPLVVPPNDETERRKEKLELYKLEYQKCADRYDNIYRAVWTNFSYVVAVAGLFLTFGGSRLPYPELGWIIAILLLLFWYLASYIPLGHYGDKAAARLSELETIINVFSFGAPGPLPRQGLYHFSEYEASRHTLPSWPQRLRSLVGALAGEAKNLWLWQLRVRFFVTWLALVLVLALIAFSISLIASFFSGQTSRHPAELKLEIKATDGEEVKKNY